MATNGGSINLRMSLQGAEQVKAELASIGPAGSKMARDLDRAMRAPAPGMKALDAASGQVRQGIEGLAGRTGPLGAGLSSLGGIGLAAAAGLGVLAIGLTKAREAMQWADELTATADRIGTSAEALQGWRYAAEEVDVSTQSLEANMEKLNSTLGAFKSGVGDAKLKPVFEALGITPDQLTNVETADQMLLILADTLGQVQDRAVQVKFAKALGVEESLPLLRLGADGIRELTAEAERLGLVAGQDVVQALSDADRQMEIAQQRIDSSMRLAVVGLADDFADVVSAIASIIAWLSRLDQALEKFSGGDGSKRGPRGVVGIISDTVRGRTGAEGDAARDEGLRNQPGWQRFLGFGQNRREFLERQDRERASMAAGLRDLADGTGEYAAKAPGWERPDRPARGGGGRSAADRDAERQRREAERELERIRTDELRAADDYQRRMVREGATPAIRAEAARLLAESEAAQEAWTAHLQRKTIEDAGLWTEEAEARAGNIQGLRNVAREDEERERIKREQEIAARASAEAEQAYVDISADILSLASSGARTAADRQKIELELLSIAQARQRADLEAQIAASAEGPARQRLVDALNLLADLHGKERTEVKRRNSGPLGDWRDDQLQGWGEISEHLQGEALDALDGLNEGLRDAWKNAESAGDAFAAMGDVAVDALGRVVDALMEVAIQKLLIDPLVNGIFGGQQGQSGGGLLGSFLSNLGGSFGGGGLSPKPAGGGVTVTGSKGFARGGIVGATGLYPVGEEAMELVELPGGARVHDAHRTNAILSGMDSRLQRTGFASGGQPIVNLTANVINKTSEPVQAKMKHTPKGLDIILEPAVRAGVARMASDGSLDRVQGLRPKPIKR